MNRPATIVAPMVLRYSGSTPTTRYLLRVGGAAPGPARFDTTSTDIPPPPVMGLGTIGGFKLQIEDRAGLGYQALYEETAESRQRREQQRLQRAAMRDGYRPPEHKPDKRARRLIQALGDIDAS